MDTKIHNIRAALSHLASKDVGLVFAKVSVDGPQKLFYRFLDFVRRRIPVTASGELMLIKNGMFDKVLPLKPCKAEDSCILFKVLELKQKAIFSEECFVYTQRTKIIRKEEDYKRRTVTGLYQALTYTRPPSFVRLFYILLPLICPVLLFSGKSGFYWTKGILRGFADYLRGDRIGSWTPM